MSEELRTLKDIEKEDTYYAIGDVIDKVSKWLKEHTESVGLNGKVELKDYYDDMWLVDIQKEVSRKANDHYQDLKAEAIKYIKDSLKDFRGRIGYIDGRLIGFIHDMPEGTHDEQTEHDHFLQGRISVLIELFNINMEDLK